PDRPPRSVASDGQKVVIVGPTLGRRDISAESHLLLAQSDLAGEVELVRVGIFEDLRRSVRPHQVVVVSELREKEGISRASVEVDDSVVLSVSISDE
ncbi:hypothetical protein PMAYCL1PPCAC_21892, partial [Pristionchus mayeri]